MPTPDPNTVNLPAELSVDSPGDEPMLSLKEPDAPLTLDVIKTQLAERHQLARNNLAELRAQRDNLARRIRAAVAEEAEADRLVRAFTPRTKTKKPK